MDGDEPPPDNGWLSGGGVAAAAAAAAAGDNEEFAGMNEAMLASMIHQYGEVPPLPPVSCELLFASSTTGDHTLSATAIDDCDMKPPAKPNHQKNGKNSNFTQLISPHDVANDNSELLANHHTESAATKHSVSGGHSNNGQSIHFREESNPSGRIRSTSSSKQSKLAAPAKGKEKIARKSQHIKHEPAAARGPIPNPYLKPKTKASIFNPYAKGKKPSSAATSNTPNAIPKRMLRSMKKVVGLDEIPSKVEPFTGSNQSLLKDVLMFNMALSKEVIASQKAEAADVIGGSSRPTTTELANTVAQMSSLVVQRQETHVAVWDNASTSRMCQAVNDLDVQYNDFFLCKRCGTRPAVTCRPAKPGDEEEGPGSHPPMFCWDCAPIELGNDCLKNPASCHCGKEMYYNYTLCRDCRQRLPCSVDGCEYDGNVDPSKLRCPRHLREYHVSYHEKSQEIKSCLRCGEELMFYRSSSTGATIRNICIRPTCASKCAYQFDDGSWCSSNREKEYTCYCGEHFRQKKSVATAEYRQAKKNGTFEKSGWKEGEVELLTKLMQKHKRTNGTVIWKQVFTEFRNVYPNYTDTAIRSKGKLILKELKEKNG